MEHGGLALLIHEYTPVQLLDLTTRLQTIAATVYINKSINLCSIYNSNSQTLVEVDLNELIRQLPQP